MAKAPMSRVEELLASPPPVEAVDVLGMKNRLAWCLYEPMVKSKHLWRLECSRYERLLRLPS